MKMQYSADADILILILQETPPVNAISEPGGVIVSYDEAGEPVSVEFLSASKRQLFRPGETNLPIRLCCYSELCDRIKSNSQRLSSS